MPLRACFFTKTIKFRGFVSLLLLANGKLTHTTYAESYLTHSFLAPTGALGDRILMSLRA